MTIDHPDERNLRSLALSSVHSNLTTRAIAIADRLKLTAVDSESDLTQGINALYLEFSEELKAEMSTSWDFSKEIRAGNFDSGLQARRAHQILLQNARARLKISNPDYVPTQIALPQ